MRLFVIQQKGLLTVLGWAWYHLGGVGVGCKHHSIHGGQLVHTRTVYEYFHTTCH